MDRIEFYLRHRAGEGLAIGAILFSLEDGVLGSTKDAEMLLRRIRREKAESADKQGSSVYADEQADQEKKTGGTDKK